jgi:hypothetical protein
MAPRHDEMHTYAGEHWTLFQLHRPDEMVAGKSAAKVPLFNAWQKTPDHSESDLAEAIEHGRNMGVRPRADQLIIDVDPRNGGDDAFAQLCADTGFDPATCPTVKTGGGGRHLYTRKKSDAEIYSKLPAYPGIDFLSAGRFAVAAGSLHESGSLYVWDRQRPALDEALLIPPRLVEALKRKPPTEAQLLSGEAVHTADEINTMLHVLDAEALRPKWYAMLLSCHRASGGAARHPFVEWSKRDPKYANKSNSVIRMWNAVRNDRPGELITHRTLYEEVIAAGMGCMLPPGTVSRASKSKRLSDADIAKMFGEG